MNAKTPRTPREKRQEKAESYWVDDALDAVFQDDGVEVDQETEFEVHDPQVGVELGLVKRGQ